MQAEGIDGWVAELYGQAGADLESPPGPVALARALLGPRSVRTVAPAALRTRAALAHVSGEWRIYVHRTLPAEQMGFAVAHELAEWALGHGASEADCNALGAALIAPRAAFLRAVDTGGGVAGAAAALRTTESLAWLRYGEVTGTPLCLVAPTTVRLRGRPYSWPANENELRGLATARRRGLVKARLRDDRRRTAVVAEQLPLPFRA